MFPRYGEHDAGQHIRLVVVKVRYNEIWFNFRCSPYIELAWSGRISREFPARKRRERCANSDSEEIGSCPPCRHYPEKKIQMHWRSPPIEKKARGFVSSIFKIMVLYGRWKNRLLIEGLLRLAWNFSKAPSLPGCTLWELSFFLGNSFLLRVKKRSKYPMYEHFTKSRRKYHITYHRWLSRGCVGSLSSLLVDFGDQTPGKLLGRILIGLSPSVFCSQKRKSSYSAVCLQ